MSCFELGLASQLSRETGNGSRVDVALVPFLQHREVGAAGLPILALLPALARQEVGRGGENVGRAAQEVALAVGVEVDSVFDVVRRHELGLADFTGPRA